MIRKSIITLVTLAAIGGATLPALASSTDSVFGGSDDQQAESLKATVAHRLEVQGIKVNYVDEWGGYVRADVQFANGQRAVRFFQADTLSPVSIDHLN